MFKTDLISYGVLSTDLRNTFQNHDLRFEQQCLNVKFKVINAVSVKETVIACEQALRL